MVNEPGVSIPREALVNHGEGLEAVLFLRIRQYIYKKLKKTHFHQKSFFLLVFPLFSLKNTIFGASHPIFNKKNFFFTQVFFPFQKKLKNNTARKHQTAHSRSVSWRTGSIFYHELWAWKLLGIGQIRLMASCSNLACSGYSRCKFQPGKTCAQWSVQCAVSLQCS